jgi:hypothetical protein
MKNVIYIFKLYDIYIYIYICDMYIHNVYIYIHKTINRVDLHDHLASLSGRSRDVGA